MKIARKLDPFVRAEGRPALIGARDAYTRSDDEFRADALLRAAGRRR